MIDYTSRSEEELQQLILLGDDLAEEEFLARYSELVRQCARPLFLAGGDRDDLIQEGMIALQSAIMNYSPKQNVLFRTYAEHCIRNRLYSAVKSANRLKHTPLNDGLSIEQLSEDSDSRLTDFITVGADPEEILIARESKDELYNAFAQCLSRFEQKVLAFYLEGYSYSKIAAQLGKPEKSIDNAVQRIRRKLARYLKPGVISTEADRK